MFDRKAYMKEYRQINKVRLNAMSKAYREAHPERMAELKRAWADRKKMEILKEMTKV